MTLLQVYCTLVEQGQSSRCGQCDSTHPDKAHPANLVLDGSDRSANAYHFHITDV